MLVTKIVHILFVMLTSAVEPGDTTLATVIPVHTQIANGFPRKELHVSLFLPLLLCMYLSRS